MEAMTGAMEIRFTPRAEDYTALARYWTYHENRLLGMERRWGVLGLAILMVSLAALLYFVLPPDQTTDLFQFLLLAGGLATLLVILLLTVWLHLMVKRLPGEMTVALTPEGLRHGNAKAEALTEWNVIEHVGLTPGHLFFMFRKNRGVPIPRRAFASADDYQAAVDSLHRHLPAQKIGTPEQG